MAIDPRTVTSPKERLKDHRVIHEAPDQSIAIPWSLAIGIFDGRRALLVRWDGDSPLGNPVSSGYPTWFVLPNDLHESSLTVVSEPNQSSARDWLNGLDPTNWADKISK